MAKVRSNKFGVRSNQKKRLSQPLALDFNKHGARTKEQRANSRRRVANVSLSRESSVLYSGDLVEMRVKGNDFQISGFCQKTD